MLDEAEAGEVEEGDGFREQVLVRDLDCEKPVDEEREVSTGAGEDGGRG